ncbi:MAG: hypothetical protein KAI40_03020 [Desulfobacterales bacterium]|nr:hypothetical protein [Desulfobacterales bacterium]
MEKDEKPVKKRKSKKPKQSIKSDFDSSFDKSFIDNNIGSKGEDQTTTFSAELPGMTMEATEKRGDGIGGKIGTVVGASAKLETSFEDEKTDSNSDARDIKDNELSNRIKVERDGSLDEKSLNVEEYAQILYELFISTTKEFCFALYGQWGRGKTYLAEVASKKFEKSNHLIVNFNAWKYRKTPDLWIYLHESFLSAVRCLGWFTSIMISIRFSIIKYKLIPLICLYFFYIAMIITPLSKITELTSWMYYGLGLAGFSTIAGFLKIITAKNYQLHLKELYGSLTSYRENLGIQEVLGDDLRRLIIACVPDKFFGVEKNFLIYSSVFSVLLVLGFEIFYNFNSNAIMYLIILAALSLQLILISISLHSKWNKKRIILSIDDIDRCDHSQVLNIIESLKLLLEQTEINQRIQILLLVDEEKLDFSIKQRFCELIENKQKEIAELKLIKSKKEKLLKEYKENLIREHKEKLITSHIRLTPLTDMDRKKFIERLLDYSKDTPEHKEEINQSSDGQNPVDIDEKNQNIYSEEETKYFLNSYNRMGNFTPRQIRLFFIKYQLCRLMVSKLPDVEATHQDMIDGILNIYDPNKDNKVIVNNADLIKIIDQIK